MGGAHVQCIINHYAEFECLGMITVGVTDFTNQKKCRSTPIKNEKIIIKCAQNVRCTSSICVNNNYAKFEYKGMKTV